MKILIKALERSLGMPGWLVLKSQNFFIRVISGCNFTFSLVGVHCWIYKQERMLYGILRKQDYRSCKTVTCKPVQIDRVL